MSEKRQLTLATSALFLLFLIFGHWLHRGGALHPEAATFLPHYLGEGSLGQKIFDPNTNDWTQYQGREFSYFLDWIDAHALRGWNALGWSIYYSTLHLAGIGFLCFYLVMASYRRFGARAAELVTYFVALFLVSPTPLLTWDYFRSSKIIVACLLLPALFIATEVRSRRAHAWGLAALTAGMGLADRQGVFFGAALAALLAIPALRERGGVWKWRGRMFGAATGVAVCTLYNQWLGPALIHHFNGYWPDFFYQRFGRLRNEREYGMAQWVREGFFLLLSQINLFFGGLRWPMAIATLGAWLGVRCIGLDAKGRLKAAGALAVTVAGFWLLNSLMIVRHQDVVGNDIRRIYYWTPCLVVFLFGAAYACQSLAGTRAWAQWAFRLTLAVMIGLNLRQVPEHMDYLMGFMMKPRMYDRQWGHRACLRTGDTRMLTEEEGNACRALRGEAASTRQKD